MFIQGVKNLITWFPIIWLDRQWDHMYFLEILEKKLKLMEDYFEDGQIIVDSKGVAKTIRTSRILITRIKNDQYGDLLHDRLDKKWGEGEFNWKDRPDGLCELDIKYDKVLTEEDQEQHTKEMKEIWKQERLSRDRDKEYFAKMFIKHLDRWWE